MNIRDDVADILDDVQEKERRWGHVATPGMMADALAPVIRRIQAEALRDARADLQVYTDSGAPFGHQPVEEFLGKRADRIERGE